MANAEHLELLKQGVKRWNCWRERYPDVLIDLQGADLRGLRFNAVTFCPSNSNSTRIRANLRNVVLSNADLSFAQLAEADFSEADLRESKFDHARLANVNFDSADMRKASFIRADAYQADFEKALADEARFIQANLVEASFVQSSLKDAFFLRTDLMEARFENADLRAAKLPGAWLNRASFYKANLRNANLISAQAVGTHFKSAQLTGACVKNWVIDRTTLVDELICDYIYRGFDKELSKFTERSPREGAFKAGEFVALFQKSVDTVDLVFTDGLDWQALFDSMQKIRQKYNNANINIQSLERQLGGVFVVRFDVAKFVRVNFPKELMSAYGEIRQLKDQMLKMEGKLELCKEQGMKNNYYFNNNQIGSFAEKVQGNLEGSIINNYGPSTEDITRLLTALREQANTFPIEQKDDALDALEAMQDDLAKPEPDQGRIGRHLKKLRRVAIILGAIASGAATVSGDLTTFTNNVNELTEKLGIPIEQVQPNQIPPANSP